MTTKILLIAASSMAFLYLARLWLRKMLERLEARRQHRVLFNYYESKLIRQAGGNARAARFHIGQVQGEFPGIPVHEAARLAWERVSSGKSSTAATAGSSLADKPVVHDIVVEFHE